MVVMHRGWEGYVVSWTEECSGCTERGDYGALLSGPCGCADCGYTGKRRRREWVPFDPAGWHAHRDRVYARHDRFCGYLRGLRRERAA